MSDTVSIFTTVLSYSIFILLAPISMFFITKFLIFEGLFHTDTVTTNVWSAVAAVVVLHIALGMYILRAYGETPKDKASSMPTKED